MRGLFRKGRIIVIPSHWLGFVYRNCDRVVLMDGGKIKKIGGREVVKEYLKMK